MTMSWDLSLSVDAHGHDDTRVSAVPGRCRRAPQLIVRAGLVMVHCLDGASVNSAGLAWATARYHAREWLPDLHGEDRSRSRQPESREFGGAYPAGSIIFDGRQPFQVNSRAAALLVTVGPLQVAVHDWTALDTHVRVWTEATAVASRLFPGKAVPFTQLTDLARKNALREIDAKIERRYTREPKPRRPRQPPGRSRG